MAVDKAWHEKSPSRINLPTSSNRRTADRMDSVARNSDIVRPLKYGRTVEDSRVVYYEVARITIAGFHIRTPSLMLCHLKSILSIQNSSARFLQSTRQGQTIHLCIGKYVALIAAADMTGHYGVGVLLETCLAEKLAFVERTRRLITNLIEHKVAMKLAA